MTQKNPEYDFKWCPGCGDFGVRRVRETWSTCWKKNNRSVYMGFMAGLFLFQWGYVWLIQI